MNQHNISDSSLLLSLMLVLVALLISQKEKLGMSKDILWSVARHYPAGDRRLRAEVNFRCQ